MLEDVTVENVETTTENETQDHNVETEVETTDAVEQEVNSQEDVPVEQEAPEETVESRLERLERENEAKQRKINRQTAANRQALEKLEQQRREYEEKLSQLNVQEVENTAPAKPKLEDFDSYDDFNLAQDKYAEDLAEYRAKDILNKREKEFLEQKQKQEMQRYQFELEQKREKQEQDYIAINPNYKASKAEFQDFLSTANVNKEMEAAIVHQSFKGNVAQLIDYFGSNGGEKLSELEEIIKLNPIDAAIQIHEIQKSFTTPKSQKTKPAPKPIGKIKSKSRGKKSGSQMSGKELVNWLNS